MYSYATRHNNYNKWHVRYYIIITMPLSRLVGIAATDRYNRQLSAINYTAQVRPMCIWVHRTFENNKKNISLQFTLCRRFSIRFNKTKIKKIKLNNFRKK